MTTRSISSEHRARPARWFMLSTLLAVTAFLAGRWSVDQNVRVTNQASATRTPLAAVGPTPPPAPQTRSADLVSTSSALGWNEPTWSRVHAQPGSVARNSALAAQLEALARTDPARAFSLAVGEKNLLLRDMLVQAALRGWADVAPGDAVTWVLTLDDASKRGSAMETVFGRVAANAPDEALRLGKQLFQKDPTNAISNACALANAFCSAGNFESAQRLAAESGDLGPVASSILRAKTYSTWAQLQPEPAARAASALADPVARNEALTAAVGGWGQVDPAGATQYAAQLASGPDSVQVLGRALRQWAVNDAPAATAWVAANEARLGSDDGVAAVAGAGFLKPSVSAEWAATIADPALRSQTTLNLLRTWAISEPEAARDYFAQTKDLAAADREQAAALFAPPSGP